MRESYSYPLLTTINQNTSQVDRRVIEILLHELIKDRSGLIKDEVVPKLIVRASTRSLSSRIG